MFFSSQPKSYARTLEEYAGLIQQNLLNVGLYTMTQYILIRQSRIQGLIELSQVDIHNNIEPKSVGDFKT